MATGVSVAERLCRLWATAAAVTVGTLPVRSTLSVDDIDRFGDRERGCDISCEGKEGRGSEDLWKEEIFFEIYYMRDDLCPWLRENVCLADGICQGFKQI